MRAADWIRPAAGAEPMPPYPVNSVLRWVLAAIFIAYWRLGQLRDAGAWDAVFIAFMLTSLGAAEIAFLVCRREPARLHRAWAFILPFDILVLVGAGALDSADLSPIPLMSVATIFTASAMFQSRYTVALTVFASCGVLLSHAAVDIAVGSFSLLAPALLTTVIAGAGGFAASRGRAEAHLRASLIAAQEREAANAEALRSALEAARTSEARFDALLEYAPALILLGDRKMNSILASREVREMFGDPGSTFEAVQNWAQTFLSDEAHVVSAALARAMAGESSSLEFRATDLGGTSRDLSAVFFAMEDGLGLIARDVTEERALAAQVARAQQMETLGTLAGGVAHDFNNLLTAILGNLYLIRQDLPGDSPLLPMVDDAKQAGERGADLVRRLLAYGRPTVERTERVELGRLVTETAALAARVLTPQVELRVEPPPPGAAVNGNFGSLQQVLLNLMINARDAMPDGGVVTLSCRPLAADGREGPRRALAAGDYFAIRVADTGTGIPPELVERIFDPFVTTKEVGKGTGLGLSTALGIVRAHGGWLDVETKEGVGSTFRMLLPAAASVQLGAA